MNPRSLSAGFDQLRNLASALPAQFALSVRDTARIGLYRQLVRARAFRILCGVHDHLYRLVLFPDAHQVS